MKLASIAVFGYNDSSPAAGATAPTLAELKEHLETYGQASGGVHIHLGSDDSETSSSSGETELSVQSAPASFQL